MTSPLLAQHNFAHRPAGHGLDAGQQLRLAGEPAAAVVPHLREDRPHRLIAPLERELSLTICTLPQRSHSMRRNHDGKAANGSSRASAAVGSGSVAVAAPVPHGRRPVARHVLFYALSRQR